MSEPTLADLLADQTQPEIVVLDRQHEYTPPQPARRAVRNVLTINGLPTVGVKSLIGKQFDIPLEKWLSVKRVLDRAAWDYGLHVETDHGRWRWRYNKRGGKTFYGGMLT